MNHPIVPVRTYVAVWAALIALTITTVAVSKLELGEFNFVAAMTIAVAKGSLVALVLYECAPIQLFDQTICWRGLFLDGDFNRFCPKRLSQPGMAASHRVVEIAVLTGPFRLKVLDENPGGSKGPQT